ncbi:MAG: hypothetical protein Hals2KO_20120 [Halioglobus sp.]
MIHRSHRSATPSIFSALLLLLNFTVATPAAALSMAPEEFAAARQLACVLAEQSLGQLNEDEYGARTHTLLEGFEASERDSILAKAIGYYDGLMFDIAEEENAVNHRLEDFVASNTCRDSGFRTVDYTVSL